MQIDQLVMKKRSDNLHLFTVLKFLFLEVYQNNHTHLLLTGMSVSYKALYFSD